MGKGFIKQFFKEAAETAASTLYALPLMPGGVY